MDATVSNAARLLAGRGVGREITCAQCGTRFARTTNRAVYCSARCKYLARRSRETTKHPPSSLPLPRKALAAVHS